MTKKQRTKILAGLVFVVMAVAMMFVSPQARAQQQLSSFSPVIEEPFAVVLKRDKAAKPRVMSDHQKLLEARYEAAALIKA